MRYDESYLQILAGPVQAKGGSGSGGTRPTGDGGGDGDPKGGNGGSGTP